MRLAILGPSAFTNLPFLTATLDGLRQLGPLSNVHTLVMSGDAGVGTLAVQYARQRGLRLREFAPDYAALGPQAARVRNQLLVGACDALVVLQGIRKGLHTRHALRLARRLGRHPVLVVHVPGGN